MRKCLGGFPDVVYCGPLLADAGINGTAKTLREFHLPGLPARITPQAVAFARVFCFRPTQLDLVGRAPKNAIPFEEHRINADHSLTGYVWRKNQAVFVPEISPEGTFETPDFLKTAKAALVVPFGDGADVKGALSLLSTEIGFFHSEDVGRVQLLGALIAFIHAQGRNRIANTEAASRLGRAL